MSSVGLCGSERGKAVFRVSTIAFTTNCQVTYWIIKCIFVKCFSQSIQCAFWKVPCLCVKQWKVSSQRQFLHQCLEREILAFLHCWPFQEWHKVAVIKEDRNGHLKEVVSNGILGKHCQDYVIYIKIKKFKELTLRNVSKRLFLASTLSLSMFPNGSSGKIFFGPFTSTFSRTRQPLEKLFWKTLQPTGLMCSAHF